MSLETLHNEYATWLRTEADVPGQDERLEQWLSLRLAASSAAERIQLRTFCATLGKAAVYDRVVEGR